ncbi:AraC family transcriptional regulator [candidate division KSB1 bacterium]|nr:AraC family transcriptional regulator [candidate division KSB1 bacterium]
MKSSPRHNATNDSQMLAHIKSMQRAISFMELHLQENIMIGDAAEAACCSLFHFCRTFNRIVRHTPYDYLMRRRLSEAARQLIETDRKIIEIALDFQFNSAEGFSRAFRRMFQTTPTEWRKQTIPPAHSMMPLITEEYLRHINMGGIGPVVMKKKEAMQVKGMTVWLENEPVDIKLVWQRVLALEQSSSEKRFAIRGYEDNEPFYIAGVLVPENVIGQPPWGLTTIPAGMYICCEHHGRYLALDFTRRFLFHTWKAKTGVVMRTDLEIQQMHDIKSMRDDEQLTINVWIPLE